MDNKPLQDLPPQNEESLGGSAEPQPNMITRWLERLAQLGLGELSLRIGTNVLVVLLVAAVALLLRGVNLTGTATVAASTDVTPQPTETIVQLPPEVAFAPIGISRLAQSHTIIPNRPRLGVIQYIVQPGDSIFKIADLFGLQPTTILFGNYATLKLRPDLLQAGQTLNILPVDGAYYQWQGNENLNVVASTLGADVESILDSPANQLDPDTVGDPAHPNIAAGTWLVIPGGHFEFTAWTAPAQLVRSDPSVHVWGPGVCSGIAYVQVGYGYFVYPTVDHWLSGTPFTPSIRHFGVDFAGAEGNAVYAVDAGTVVYSGWNTWGYGNLIIIDHGNGWQSLYAHLSQINVSCGQNVGQGELIGLVGMTGGTSTGPHLHFELMNTTLGYVNPLDYMPAP
jgi:murein DD-endopeptidase MepM/ murein hydrolase activator NlpD